MLAYTHLLNEQDVAAILGVSLTFLRVRRSEERRAEGPPFIRLGSLCKYPAGELEKWISKQAESGESRK